MSKACELSHNKSLTVLNIEKSEQEIISFLSNIGFANEIDQYEMEMVL